MKFYLPGYKGNRDRAEYVWLQIRAWLAGLGFPTARRRIAALVHDIKGVDHFIAVDHEMPDGQVAVAILQSDDPALFYVCTLDHGVLAGVPYPVRLDERWRVVEFEADAP